MELYRLTLRGLPQLLFAHRFQAAAGSWPYLKEPGLVEITFLERGNAVFLAENGERQAFEAPCILTDTHSRFCRVLTDAPLHSHFSFCFRVSDPPVPVRGEAGGRLPGIAGGGPEGETVCFLPRCVPAGAACDKISENIRRVVASYRSGLPSDRLGTARDVLAVLAELGKYAEEQAERGAEGSFLSPYTARAIRYIGEHVEEKIRVQEIADALKISYGYLSRVFRADTGVSLIRYLNEAKVRRVKELFLARNVTPEEAGALVGIGDVKYLSRIFKQYSGMTVSEYRKLL